MEQLKENRNGQLLSKANISVNAQAITVNDEVDAFKDINADLDESLLKELLEDLAVKIETLAATDDNVVTNASPLTDQEILERGHYCGVRS